PFLVMDVKIDRRVDVLELLGREPGRDGSKTFGVTLAWLPDKMRHDARKVDDMLFGERTLCPCTKGKGIRWVNEGCLHAVSCSACRWFDSAPGTIKINGLRLKASEERVARLYKTIPFVISALP